MCIARKKIYVSIVVLSFCFLIYSQNTFARMSSKIRKGHDFSKIKPNAKYKQDEIIIKFTPKQNNVKRSEKEKNNVLASLGEMKIKKSFTKLDLDIVEVSDGNIEHALKVLNQKREVLYAEPNYEITIYNLPNDTSFNQLWGLDNTGQTGGTSGADISALDAWDIATHAEDVIVAVIDTGVDYDHEDLADNMWINQDELVGDPNVDDDGNGYVDDIYGYDFSGYTEADQDNDPSDPVGHGTHVAGTIGAVGNNSSGITGVCWDVEIMPAKIMPPYYISEWVAFVSNATEAIEYAVDNGAKIINASWGIDDNYSQSLKDAIETAGNSGVLFVAAAGNYPNTSPANNDIGPQYPSNYDLDNIIAVMSTDHDDNMSSFSHYGATSVDLAAPGSDIYSCMPNDEYGYGSGTSMAAPHVSGACALVWSMYPHLTMSQVKQIILDSADELNSLQGLCVTGARLNLYQALLHAHPLSIDIVDDIADPNGCVLPGDEITFTISYSNPSTTNSNDPNYFGAAEDVEIQFPLPVELTYTDIFDTDYNMFTRTFTWDIGTLEPQESGTITVTLTVNQNAEPLGVIHTKIKMLSSVGYGEATEETRVCCWGGDVIHVDAFADGPAETGVSWDNAYKTLQKALTRARQSCGNEIWVARGIYTPTQGSDPGISFDMIEGVNLYGGFAGTEDSLNDRNFLVNRTYLSGNVDVGGDDDSYVVVNTEPDSAITSSTVLDGFIVTHSTEAGIYCNEADLTIQNCVITDNDANGINVYKSAPFILDSIITDNAVAGIYDCNEADVSIEGCIISMNGGNGISCRRNAAFSLTNSLLYGNNHGISFADAAAGSLIRNNTIVDNLKTGIEVVQGNTPTIKNCIIWNNSEGDLSGCSATYSCFDDGYQGTGNTDNDPDFAYKDPAAGNYHLHTASPCIDTGDSSSYSNEYDIDGETRVYGSLVDMGADEVYSCDDDLSLDDVYNDTDFNSDGVINNFEFSKLAYAWLSHDPNDPYLPTDPNDPDYISDPNTFAHYDVTQDFSFDYAIDLADFDVFANNWLWLACWYQTDTWISTFGNVEGDTDEMLNEQITGTAYFASGAVARHIDERPIAEQLDNAQDMVGKLESIWLDDPDIQNHIEQDAWDNFMKQLYTWLNTLESQYVIEQINSE